MIKKIIISLVLIFGACFWTNFSENKNKYNGNCFESFNLQDKQKKPLFSFDNISILFNNHDHIHLNDYTFNIKLHFFTKIPSTQAIEMSYRFGSIENKINNVLTTDKKAYSNDIFTIYCPRTVFDNNSNNKVYKLIIAMYFDIHFILYDPIKQKEVRWNYYILTCNLNLLSFINFNRTIISTENLFNVNIPNLIKFDMNKKIILVSSQIIQISFNNIIKNYLLKKFIYI